MPALSEAQICRGKLPMGMSTPQLSPSVCSLLSQAVSLVGSSHPRLGAAGLFVLAERLPELGICFTALLCPLMALKTQPGFGTEM